MIIWILIGIFGVLGAILLANLTKEELGYMKNFFIYLSISCLICILVLLFFSFNIHLKYSIILTLIFIILGCLICIGGKNEI